MRHRNAGAVRTLIAIGKVIAHDLAARVLAALAESNIAMIPIGGKALGRPVRGEGDGSLPLPVHALPADFRKLGMADVLRDRPERCTGPDRLQLLMIAYKDDLRPARLSCRRLRPETSSSWTTSALTRVNRCETLSARQGPSCSSCRLTVRT